MLDSHVRRSFLPGARHKFYPSPHRQSATLARMRLTKLFMLTTALLLTLVAAMLFRTGIQEWTTYRATKDGLAAMQHAYLAMIAAEKASFERGPSNGFMGSSETEAPPIRERLQKARNATDQAFADVLNSLEILPQPLAPDQQAAAIALRRARDQLRRARIEIDRIAELPKTARDRTTVMAAVDTMFGVIDIVMESVTILSSQAERIYPELSDALVGSRMAAELREYAGRLGSQFTAALTQQAPLGPVELRNIPLLQGRIEQLRRLIEVRATIRSADSRENAALDEMQAHYFGVGLPLVDAMTKASTARPSYGMNADGFAARYVPEMASIVNLRDTMVKVAIEGGNTRHASAYRNLLLQVAIGGIAMLIEIAVFLFIRRRVLQPLLGATHSLVNIAEGKLDTAVPSTRRHDEIGDMLDAVAALKMTSLEKQRLEREREHLIGELKEASNVDYLTGLLNRRAFADAAASQLATARRQNWMVALIVFDIDHFKAINDQYGHSQGDAVLVEIARLAKRELRLADVIARFGGEEFIVLAVDCDAAAANALAERIRASIAAAAYGGSKPYSVTVSLGVFAVAADAITELGQAIQRADSALYTAKAQGRNRVVAA